MHFRVKCALRLICILALVLISAGTPHTHQQRAPYQSVPRVAVASGEGSGQGQVHGKHPNDYAKEMEKLFQLGSKPPARPAHHETSRTPSSGATLADSLR